MMRYLAGLFDAEGYITLSPGGNTCVGLEITCQESANLYQEYFEGSITQRKRDSNKDSYVWRCSSENLKRFITEIEPYSVLKRPQLLLLQQYIRMRRERRREVRKEFVHQIAACKNPRKVEREELEVPLSIFPDENFYRWLAGFMEGDGSFCCWESKTLNHKKPSFSISIEAWNTHPEAVIYIKQRLPGSIGVNKQNKNPVWRWVCSPDNSLSVLARLYPHLISKKDQCKLLMEFRTILITRKRKRVGRNSGKCKRGGWNNPDSLFTQEEASRLREIICHVKFLHQHSSLKLP